MKNFHEGNEKISSEPMKNFHIKDQLYNINNTNIKKKYIKPDSCQPFVIDIMKKYEELNLPDYEFLNRNSMIDLKNRDEKREVKFHQTKKCGIYNTFETRIKERISEMCFPVCCKGESRRKSGTEKFKNLFA